MDDSIRDNRDKRRFELDIDGQVIFANYRRQDGVLSITHVEAPPALRGTGLAGRLMQGVVAIARAEDRKIAPLCGYAAAWLRRHREFQDLVA
jgi:predicted GNAT family acetyltransferase